MKIKINKISDILFISVLILIVVGGLIRTSLALTDVVLAENRIAYKISNVPMSSFWSGEYQENMELSFADQIPFSAKMKSFYNTITSFLMKTTYDIYSEDLTKSEYILLVNDIYNLGGTEYLVYRMYDRASAIPKLDTKSEMLKTMYNEISGDANLYLYYIENDTDIDFVSSEKTGVYEYLNEKLTDTNIVLEKFEADSFEEYKKMFYKTDHHWNYEGSYKGYKEVLDMLTSGETPLKPKEIIKAEKVFAGSKARNSGTSSIYNEDFYGYYFELPEHKTYINGTLATYGNEEGFLENPELDISYGLFYGDDYGEVCFDYNNPEKENILIIGNSYDNAIIEVLGSHFNKLYVVDNRHYDLQMNKIFDTDKYVKEKEISKVIIIGDINMMIENSMNW